MAYKLRAILSGLGLVACGIVASEAWHQGLWGTVTGAALIAVWIVFLHGWSLIREAGPAAAVPPIAPVEVATHRLLLDAAPTPMLSIEGERDARALNRAARRLFATDDRILPMPPALADRDMSHFRHEGRSWRIDRVLLATENRTVVTLIDIEQEERAAEARATAELIQVLGHELLNGLAPIASLAESGIAAIDTPVPGAIVDRALLREILGTLTRHAEGLQRFVEGYRALARLPEPCTRPVSIAQLVEDLTRLFAGRWPQVALTVDVADVPAWPMDRDQINQALWALIQNGAEAATADRGGDARIEIAVNRIDAGLALDVRDNGNGISLGSEAAIFRPFHTTKAHGTGIGLSLARQIAHAHGGTLSIQHAEPTTFRLLLPGAAPFSDDAQ
ncbi:ATP-binding protein [Novosphingobium sp. BL-8A]|uniref:sensor histidine kinase n=1 Tax=Novosphingobium sp. BL-8A TaxID=3127639 RepID=UPI0037577773